MSILLCAHFTHICKNAKEKLRRDSRRANGFALRIHAHFTLILRTFHTPLGNGNIFYNRENGVQNVREGRALRALGPVGLSILICIADGVHHHIHHHPLLALSTDRTKGIEDQNCSRLGKLVWAKKKKRDWGVHAIESTKVLYIEEKRILWRGHDDTAKTLNPVVFPLSPTKRDRRQENHLERGKDCFRNTHCIRQERNAYRWLSIHRK